MKQAWIFSDNAELVNRVKANFLIELNIPGHRRQPRRLRRG